MSLRRRSLSAEYVEFGTVGLGALLLALIVYTPHILHGGWVLDDWTLAADFRLAPDQHFSTLFHAAAGETPRVGSAALLVVMWEIGGTGQAPYLAVGAVLAAIEGFLLYVLVRRTRGSRVVAGAAGALLIALPIIDSTRLWAAAYSGTVAVILTLGGLLLATAGLRRPDRTARTLFHGGALFCFLAATLTYEVAGPLIAAGGLLYLRAGVWPWLKRAPLDLAVVAAALVLTSSRTPGGARQPDTDPAYMADRVTQIWRELRPVALSIVPFGEHLSGVLGFLILMSLTALAAYEIGRRGPLATHARAFAALVGVGVIGSAAGFVMLLPADPYYGPRLTGLGNRSAVGAAVGLVLVVTGVLMLVGVAIAVVARRPRLAMPAGAVLLAITLAHNIATEWTQQRPWRDSWVQAQRVVSAVKVTVPRDAPADSGIVTFHHTTNVLPADVSVFSASWDLKGAVRLALNNPTVVAHPWSPQLDCTATDVRFPDDGDAQPLRYGDLWFVDTAGYRSYRIASRAACERVRGSLLT